MHADPHGSAVVLQILVFLAATSLLVPLFRRARLSAVLAFLVIGLLVGPSGLGQFSGSYPILGAFTLEDSQATRWLAEMGVVFLLFVIGLEVSSERLWALRRYVLGLGSSQILVTALAITLIAMAFGHAFPVAAVTGLAFALSSTALVLQLLGETRQMSGPVGRAGFSVLLLQDVAVVPILFVVGALAGDAPGEARGGAAEVALALAGSVAAMGAIFVLGRFALRPLLRWAASVESREVFIAAVLLVAIGAAAAAQAVGLSMALGAFLAGLLLAETEFRHQIETDIDPFKGLLLGLFFVTVGMQINVALALGQPLAVLAGIVGLFALKAAILAPLARAFGLSWPKAIELALLLGQAGEFAFVIIGLARANGVYPDATADYMLLVVTASIFCAPFVASFGARLARRLEAGTPNPAAVDLADFKDLEGHVVIAGYGRVGQMLGGLLQQQEIAHVALDADATLVAALRKNGWPVYYGDASRAEIMSALGAGRAGAIVVTMNDPAAVERVVAAARAAWPQVTVYARARDSAHAAKLHAAGAALASPETVEAALQLGEALLNGLGVPDEAARRIIEEQREAERAKSISAG